MNIETIQTEAKKTKNKGGHGGPRPGAGRKKQPDEAHLIEKLYPLEDAAFKALKARLDDNDPKAIEIYFRYYFGLPTQRIESKVEGNLNQVNIEVLRPQTETLKKVG